MKPGIHPKYKEIKVSCACGNKFSVGSTLSKDELNIEICNLCHPFYTGKQKIVDTAGRVEKYMQKYERAKQANEDIVQNLEKREVKEKEVSKQATKKVSVKSSTVKKAKPETTTSKTNEKIINIIKKKKSEEEQKNK